MTNHITRRERRVIGGQPQFVEVVYEEGTVTPLTEQNVVESILSSYISNANIVEDIILDLQTNNII